MQIDESQLYAGEKSPETWITNQSQTSLTFASRRVFSPRPKPRVTPVYVATCRQRQSDHIKSRIARVTATLPKRMPVGARHQPTDRRPERAKQRWKPSWETSQQCGIVLWSDSAFISSISFDWTEGVLNSCGRRGRECFSSRKWSGQSSPSSYSRVEVTSYISSQLKYN